MNANSRIDATPVEGSGLAVVRAAYAAYLRRDAAAVAALFHPDCEVFQSPELPWGGEHRALAGLQAFMGGMLAAIDTRIEEEVLFEAGDRVVSIGRSRGRALATGRAFDLPAVHLYRIEGGRIRRYEAHVDTPAMRAALAG